MIFLRILLVFLGGFISLTSSGQCTHNLSHYNEGQRNETQHNKDSSSVILVVGDSLSSAYGIDVEDGWVHLLRQRLSEKGFSFEVINASVSGDTTHGGLTRLQDALPKHNPTIVVIELGGNDGLRGQSIQVMTDNLTKMIELTRDHDAVPVILGMQIPSNYGPKYAQAFRDTYSALAQRYQVPFVEFFLEGIAIDTKFIQADGIHPNELAQPVMLDNTWPAILEAIKICSDR